jgi:gluconolactonase
MPQFNGLIVGLAIVLAGLVGGANGEDGVRVKVGEITLSVPAAWQQQEPSNRLRLGQFEIPASEGGKGTAELSIFNFGSGGSVAQQVNRWRGQFAPGRKVKAVEGVSPLGSYVFVDLSGTYKQSVGPPVLGKTKDAPGTRMLVAMIAIKEQGNYFLKLVGPEATVSANAAAFQHSFGAQPDSEKDLE